MALALTLTRRGAHDRYYCDTTVDLVITHMGETLIIRKATPGRCEVAISGPRSFVVGREKSKDEKDIP